MSLALDVSTKRATGEVAGTARSLFNAATGSEDRDPTAIITEPGLRARWLLYQRARECANGWRAKADRLTPTANQSPRPPIGNSVHATTPPTRPTAVGHVSRSCHSPRRAWGSGKLTHAPMAKAYMPTHLADTAVRHADMLTPLGTLPPLFTCTRRHSHPRKPLDACVAWPAALSCWLTCAQRMHTLSPVYADSMPRAHSPH